MTYLTAVVNNACTWTIGGELDLSAGAAVVASRGDNITFTKTGTGQYTGVLKNSGNLQLVELLGREANFAGSTRPATALGCCLDTVTQNATTGDISIVITTLANPTSGAATDGSAAVTIAFTTVIRTCKMVSPI
jgi:hypothetical protein